MSLLWPLVIDKFFTNPVIADDFMIKIMVGDDSSVSNLALSNLKLYDKMGQSLSHSLEDSGST
jgi:hypothetical protein